MGPARTASGIVALSTGFAALAGTASAVPPPPTDHPPSVVRVDSATRVLSGAVSSGGAAEHQLVDVVVAANPDLPERATVTADANSASVPLGSGRNAGVLVAATTDAGRTWRRGVVPGIVTGTGGSWDLAQWATTVAGRGTEVWTAAGVLRGACRSGVVVAHAPDGLAYGPARLLAVEPDCDHRVLRAAVAVDTGARSPYRGRVHVVWERTDVTFTDVRRLTRHSDDGGRTWSSAVEVASSDPATYFVSAVVQPDGAVHVAGVANFRASGSNLAVDVVVSSSRDGGATWAPRALALANVIGSPGNADVRCCEPKLAVARDTGTLYLAAGDTRRRSDHLNDIVLVRSVDGRRWSSPVLVNRADPAGSTERYTPSTAAYGRSVFVVWTRRDVPAGVAGTTLRQEGAVSEDDGRTFGPLATIGPVADIAASAPAYGFSDHYTGDYASTVALPGGRAWTAWARPWTVDGRATQQAWVAALAKVRPPPIVRSAG